MDRKKSGALALAAICSVAALLLITDFSPMTVTDFKDLPDQQSRVETVCLVKSIHTISNGIMMGLEDAQGGSLRAYIDNLTVTVPPMPGSYVRVCGMYRPGVQPIIFVESITILDQDKINNGPVPDHPQVA